VEERTWAYAATGWIRHDDAYGLLAGALASDLELADAVATALSDQGRPEAILVLHAALEAWGAPPRRARAAEPQGPGTP